MWWWASIAAAGPSLFGNGDASDGDWSDGGASIEFVQATALLTAAAAMGDAAVSVGATSDFTPGHLVLVHRSQVDVPGGRPPSTDTTPFALSGSLAAWGLVRLPAVGGGNQPGGASGGGPGRWSAGPSDLRDADGDGESDATEVDGGLDPLDDDTDGDGLLDGADGDLLDADDDDDGVLDGEEDADHDGVVDPGESDPSDRDPSTEPTDTVGTHSGPGAASGDALPRDPGCGCDAATGPPRRSR